MTNTPYHVDRLVGRDTPCPFDDVIDVRSPCEYAVDHAPGAVNLPVLSDDERAEVGTVYRESAFAARKLGAAYVAANVARHLRQHFAGKGKDYRPVVYCWRGGQRSAGLATVLAHVGWRVAVLRGGYKTYRRHVREALAAGPPRFTYRLIAGPTGTGKTRLLHALAAGGAQVIDLEGLARHRGSVLGGAGPQPSQKAFESGLAAAFDRLDPARPVWVEAESSRIGDRSVPPALWAGMRAAGGVVVRMPAAARVRHLLAEYVHLAGDADGLKARLGSLATRQGPRQVADWHRLVDAGAWAALVASLLASHYDPAYETSARRCHPNATRDVALADTTAAAIDGLARELLADAPLAPTATDLKGSTDPPA